MSMSHAHLHRHDGSAQCHLNGYGRRADPLIPDARGQCGGDRLEGGGGDRDADHGRNIGPSGVSGRLGAAVLFDGNNLPCWIAWRV